jgi:UDPglucose--hexose-1-phosphate uridylyltransferase
MTKHYEFTHRRRNLLNGEWVLVSPHRNNRPWLGATEAIPEPANEDYDNACPLCPGNTRANGDTNPNYAFTHAFTNDFGALTSTLADDANIDDDDLFEAVFPLNIIKHFLNCPLIRSLRW